MFEKYFSFFEREADINRCFGYLKGIHENDRLFSFDAFGRTAHYCAEVMRGVGLDEVELLPLRADGKSVYGDWRLQRAWDAVSGVLLDTEDGYSFADYRKMPCSLMMYSAATPAEGITAEVVEVTTPEEAAVLDLKDKLLLTSQAPGSFVQLAAETGAAGIVSDFFPLFPGTRDSRDDMRGIARWEGGALSSVNTAGGKLFGFCLTPEGGDELRRRLRERGRVRLYARTDCRAYDGYKYTVSGVLRGSDPNADELLIYGHLYEPGANDNASGCAVSLELASCIQAAIREGRIPRPKRSIRFVMGDECIGSAAFLESHPEIVERTVFGIVGDMVGCDVTERAKTELWHAPMSNVSLADVLISDILREYTGKERFVWSDQPFRSGSDNVIADPSFTIPTVGYLIFPALRYHSSGDTPEMIDFGVLRRSCILLGTYLLRLADADASDAAYFGSLTARAYAGQTGILGTEARNAAERTLARFLGSDAAVSPAVFPEKPAYALADGDMVPVRLTRGWIALGKSPELAGKYRMAWSFTYNKPIFWTDGKRTLWQIAVLSSKEAGTACDEASFAKLAAFYRDLERCGYVKLC